MYYVTYFTVKPSIFSLFSNIKSKSILPWTLLDISIRRRLIKKSVDFDVILFDLFVSFNKYLYTEFRVLPTNHVLPVLSPK